MIIMTAKRHNATSITRIFSGACTRKFMFQIPYKSNSRTEYFYHESHTIQFIETLLIHSAIFCIQDLYGQQ